MPICQWIGNFSFFSGKIKSARYITTYCSLALDSFRVSSAPQILTEPAPTRPPAPLLFSICAASCYYQSIFFPLFSCFVRVQVEIMFTFFTFLTKSYSAASRRGESSAVICFSQGIFLRKVLCCCSFPRRRRRRWLTLSSSSPLLHLFSQGVK